MSALASRNWLEVRMEASWPVVDSRIDGWWGAQNARRRMMQRMFVRLWSSTKLAKGAVLTHRPEFLRLTKLSTLSRATQTLLVRPAPPAIEAKWFGFSSFPFQLCSQLGQNSQLLTTQRQQPVAAWVLRLRLARCFADRPHVLRQR